MNLGEQIKHYRKEAGLTQKELADLLDVATNTIQQYELGKRQPRLEMINRIAGALGVGVKRLYPDFSMDEWKNTETYKDAQLANKLNTIQNPEKQLLISYFSILNSNGRKEAIKRVEELTEIKKYTEPDD